MGSGSDSLSQKQIEARRLGGNKRAIQRSFKAIRTVAMKEQLFGRGDATTLAELEQDLLDRLDSRWARRKEELPKTPIGVQKKCKTCSKINKGNNKKCSRCHRPLTNAERIPRYA